MDTHQNDSQRTSIQILHDYHQLSKNLKPADRVQLKQLLKISKADERRLVGLDNEDEFIVLIHTLGWVKVCSAIEEGVAQLSGTKTTDYFVENIYGRKLAIEIKSTNENEVSFAKNLVNSKIEYAKKHDHECYFAVKIHGLWLLLSADYILKKKCKISFEKDYMHSEMFDVFGERLFLFFPGLEIITTYSKCKDGIAGIQNTYGNATRIAIKVNGKRYFLITTANTEYLFISIVLEALENAMSNQEQIVKKIDSDKTVVNERMIGNTMIYLSDILTAPIKHTLNVQLGEQYTFQTYSEEMKKKDNKQLLTRKLVFDTLNLFEDYPIVMSFDHKNFYRLNDLWVENKNVSDE